MVRCLHHKVPYTTLSHPRGVVYERIDNQKMLMRAKELHKFTDGTLNKVYNKLDVILRDNKLRFGNEGVIDHEWTKKGLIRFWKRMRRRLRRDEESRLKTGRNLRRISSSKEKNQDQDDGVVSIDRWLTDSRRPSMSEEPKILAEGAENVMKISKVANGISYIWSGFHTDVNGAALKKLVLKLPWGS
nr:hypothetical protein [Tanacetum cinerariifolium]